MLLLLASGLRFWDLPHIPYMHDEISALLRIYPTLGETVQKGVIENDTHPPGVQVFEWTWAKAFGTDEAAMKLPFIVMSLLALFFLYRFACAWTGSGVALIVMALLATLQYTVMYGQIARPYAAGLFTTALLADQLTRYLGKGSRRTLIGAALAALLSAYTHHFALLLAAIMWCTVLVLVLPARRKEFLIAGGLAALLYVPNIPIFLQQLGMGGLSEWLAPPGPRWLLDYAWWLAHCSTLFAVVWGLLIATSLGLRIRHRGSNGAIWAITLLWGLLPLVIGFGYSVLRAPVLQYSVVLFSFPYLLIGVFAGLRHLRSTLVLPVVIITATISVFTLITVRKHYDIFYRSKYEAAAHGVIQAGKQTDQLALVDVPDGVIDLYLRQWKVDPANAPYMNLHGLSSIAVDSLLHSGTYTTVFLGTSSGAVPEQIAHVQAAFPFMLERHDRDGGQTHVFSVRPDDRTIDDLIWSSMILPEIVQGENWKVDADLPLYRDTTAKYATPAQWDLAGREFGAVFDKPIYGLSKGNNDVLEGRMEVTDAELGSELKLVMELQVGERTTFYRSASIAPGAGRASLIVAIPLSDVPDHGRGQHLRAYLWNPGDKAAHVASIELRVREGNPWLYGIYQPLLKPLKYR